MVFLHQEPDGIGKRKHQCVIFPHIKRLKHQAEIQQTLLQLFRNIVRVRTVQVEPDSRMFLLQGDCHFGHFPHDLGFPASDGDFSGYFTFQAGELFLRFIHQVHNFLGTPAQALPLLRQPDIPICPDQQLYTKFLLHLPDLPG